MVAGRYASSGQRVEMKIERTEVKGQGEEDVCNEKRFPEGTDGGSTYK